jgi:23S rRNA (guanosine2251-2'-O)-methyltransferase
LPRGPERRRPRRRRPASAAESHYLDGIHPVREALRAARRPLHRLLVRKGDPSAELADLVSAARVGGVPVEEAGPEEFQRRVGSEGNHQGVVLEAGPLPEVPIDDLTTGEAGSRILVALDGVEDPHNLGAIARVTDAAGVTGLILTRHRAAPLSPAVSRASAGAIEWLPVARVPNLNRSLNQLKEQGFWTFGCDPEGELELFAVPERVAAGDRVIVLGAEGRGLRPGVLREVDHTLRIPMGGRVGSLNVSTAAAVVLFELGRRSVLATPAGIP